jgi:WD40 repeat protein
MLKTFWWAMVCGSCIVACGGSADTGATTTTVATTPPSSISPATAVPTTQPSAASLVAEQHLATQTNTAYSLDWSVDGEALAVASGVEVTVVPKDLSAQNNIATVGGLRNRTIEIWDWESGTVDLGKAQRVTADSDQFAVSWSPDGTRLATLANDRNSTIQIWDTSAWTLVHQFDLPYANPRRALNWSADGQSIHDAGELNGQAVYFSMDVEDGSVQELGSLPIESVFAFTFSPDLHKIAVADEGGKVQIRAVGSGEALAEFQSVDSPADLAWNPKNSTLAILGGDASLQLWSLAV